MKKNNNSKMTVLYENTDIIVKKLNDNGRIYAGYKGETLYPVHGLITEQEFTDNANWILTYKKGTEVFSFREKRGITACVWIDGERFKDMDDGRYVSEDGTTMHAVRLEQTSNNDNYKIGFMMGFQLSA